MCYTTGGVDCVDVVRFLKLLYMLVCPEGAHIPGRYDDVPRPPPADLIVSVSHMPAPAAQTAHLPRINPVVPSKFKGLKVLGQGGQGKVELGEYDGILVAGKTFLGIPDQSLVMETMDEVQFFFEMELVHSSCHTHTRTHTHAHTHARTHARTHTHTHTHTCRRVFL